ncbi:MAG TPA: chemotaxis protein CheA [Bryobacteraceae bacterium]|nr:chemotaxis protein CheA [Bryobacteraceae bacterium]
MIDQVLAHIEDLALRVVVGVAGVPEALEALARIEKMARAAGRAPAGDVARSLAQQASHAATSDVERILTAGLENLRRTLQGAPLPVSLAQDPELIRDFVNEALEHLASVEAAVLALERDPAAADPLHATFRSFHTIKGLAGFLELADIREVSHEVETLLDRARNRELPVTTALIDVVLDSADYLKRAVAWVDAGLRGDAGAPPETAVLLARVRQALEDRPPVGSSGSTPPLAAREQVALPAAGSSPPDPSLVTSPPDRPAVGKAAAVLGFTLRVDASKLDYMMDMVGELVIAQSLLAHTPNIAQGDGGGLQRNLQELGRITAEVQRMAMSLRMTPVGQLFARLTRLVRDLSHKNGKRVRLELAGEDTELDKTIIEQLGDPLMHMVRNSLDHGIETPEDRVAKSKPPEGVVKLTASHQAGRIVIEVSDDGRGLDTKKILRRARERGLIAEGHNPSETEIYHLIFEPGFSTADQVTEVSGRGVGMDVVRKQIQGLRGRVDIVSAPDRGTTFFLRLPLTLAIIDGLIVQVGAERYILPISSVREMLRPTEDMLFTIEGRAELAMIRGELLPVLRLDRRFQVPCAVQNPCDGLLVVAESEGRCFCLLVDAMLGKQEVVIKSLGETFRHVAGVSGGAILGDGRVGLILDLNGVLREPASV